MIKVNDTCIGCGACVAIAPEVFDYQEGLSVVMDETITEKVKEAVDACPVGAIEIEETTEATEVVETTENTETTTAEETAEVTE